MIFRLFTACALLAGLTASPARADTLLDNVQGVTIGEDDKLTTFKALLIGDDGKITQVYDGSDKLPKDVQYRIDGRGRYVVPGMIDSHLHVSSLGFAALTLDLSDTTSLQQAQDRLRAYAAANPSRKWIVGYGWNHEKWGLGRFPSAAELDSVVSDRPVWLTRIDGHAGWANSAAMESAGITNATKAPEGGRIVQSAGKPSGIFVDLAMGLVERAVPQPRPEDRDLALSEAQSKLLALGVTAVADMGTTIEDWQSFRRAGDAGWLNIRIMAYARGTQAMELIGGPGPSPWLYGDKLRLNGVKLYVDGALGSRGALLKSPYGDAPGESGLALANPAQLRNFMSRAAIDKFQVAVHAIGDAANADVLNAIEEMSETYGGDRRWRIEHAQVVDPADIARFGNHGIIASMQPVHQTSDRLMAEARLGPTRLAGAYAWKSIADAGARLAFGSDAPVESPDPFVGLAVAMTREDATGEPFGGWQAQERVNRETALKAFTSNGAYAGFAEGRFGKLVPGQQADLVFIDRDPLLVPPRELREARVLETWVGGRSVYTAAVASAASR